MGAFVHAHGLSLAVGAMMLLTLACRQAVAHYGWHDTDGMWRAQAVIAGEVFPEAVILLTAILLKKRLIEVGSEEPRTYP